MCTTKVWQDRKSGHRLLTSSFIFSFAIFFIHPTVFAQEASETEPGVIYQKKTVVSFDDDFIDGDLTRPDGVYVESRKRVRHSNLIKIREHFRDQVLQSVSNL